MGGVAGVLDSALPVVVFVAVNSFAGLTWALWTAIGAGVLIAVVRLLRRKPVTQALGGLVAVGVAAFIAGRTGSAKDFFLLGIWTQLLYGGAFLLSILVRWPLIGVVWEALNGRGSGWRSDRLMRRRYTWATAVWVVLFLARFLVQRYLYDENSVGWLAAVRIAMGYPVFILGLLVSALIVLGPEVWHRPGGTWKERVAGVRQGLKGTPRPDRSPDA
ncbi:DUF3159 domain-containing protein [Nakamurella sp. YIM 132084]|uniref:DUF3159 domain-containing protein n=2 Tax=Nakamurella leprariae TaxID=2803911 RepID=A0A938YAN5_9ACTN|nr:DUF3159 domain-containing protein [Nakamurella leprariae]